MLEMQKFPGYAVHWFSVIYFHWCSFWRKGG